MAKGFVGKRTNLSNHIFDRTGLKAMSAKGTKSAEVRYRRRQPLRREAAERSLNDRVLDAEC